MTDNMKKFLEVASQDKEFIEKLNKAETPEAVVALAEEKGFTLTEEDLKQEPVSGEISDTELDAVAGGEVCGCVIGGGGESGAVDDICACVLSGIGYKKYDHDINDGRCYCVFGGAGASLEGHCLYNGD